MRIFRLAYINMGQRLLRELEESYGIWVKHAGMELGRRGDRGCEARIKGNGGEQRFLVAELKRLVG